MRLERFTLPLNISDKGRLFEYLSAVFEFAACEKLYIFPLDSSDSIVAAYPISNGSQNSVQVNFAAMLGYMFKGCEQGKFIIAHNHPDSSREPSPEDISATAFIKNKSLEYGGEMLAHYIVGTDGVAEVPSEYNYTEFLFDRDKWE